MSASLNLIPAVDISSGKSVRLAQGELSSAAYEAEPSDIVKAFVNSGAEWVHLADLDQAFGRGQNQRTIVELVRSFPNLKFQLSGGIGDSKTLEQALSSAPARINLSSSSLSDLDWLEGSFRSHQEVLAFGLDYLDGRIVPRGSSKDFGSLHEVLSLLRTFGVSQYVVTDVSRDGMLSGPNLKLLSEVFDQTGAKIISSGGVSSLDDLESLKNLGFVSSVILGKALYVGNFSLEQALEVANG